MYKHLNKYEIILASGSPRRQQFFKDLQIPFEVKLKEVEEVFPSHLIGHQITEFLAKLKADAFTDLKQNQIVITSDTIVWLDNKALGKPKDFEDAFQMLKNLSNKTHQVITSVCFSANDFQEIITDTTLVSIGNLTDEMITYYLNNFKPFDKAGSYGIQEWFGAVAVTKIDGSYNNVMGLPTHKVFDFLQKLK